MPFHLWIYYVLLESCLSIKIYIAPLQDNYSGALPGENTSFKDLIKRDAKDITAVSFMWLKMMFVM